MKSLIFWTLVDLVALGGMSAMVWRHAHRSVALLLTLLATRSFLQELLTRVENFRGQIEVSGL